MGQFENGGPAMIVHPNDPDGVEPQKDEVHQIVLRDGLALQMGVQETQAAQSSAPFAAFGQLRDVDRSGIPDQHRLHPPVAADQQTELATGFKREVGEVTRQVWRNDVARGNSAPPEVFQTPPEATV